MRILSDTWIRWWASPDYFNFYPITAFPKKKLNKEGVYSTMDKASEVSPTSCVRVQGTDASSVLRPAAGLGCCLGIHSQLGCSVARRANTRLSIPSRRSAAQFRLGSTPDIKLDAAHRFLGVLSLNFLRSSFALQVYILGYFAFVMLFIICLLLRDVTFSYWHLKGSTKLHNKLFFRVLRAPLLFFLRTPVGDILNAFAKDQVNATHASTRCSPVSAKPLACTPPPANPRH